eukprot:gene3020-16398_t
MSPGEELPHEPRNVGMPTLLDTLRGCWAKRGGG